MAGYQWELTVSDELREMRQQIEWLGRADTFTVDLMFGPVCDQFRATYLSDQRLCPEVAFYFEYCIPASIRTRDDYDVPELVAMDTYSAGEFRAFDGLAMLEHISHTTWGMTAIKQGFVEFGNDWRGSPFFLCLATGSVTHVSHDHFDPEGNMKRFDSRAEHGRNLPFNGDNLVRLSDYTAPTLVAFFEDLYRGESEGV